MWSLSQHTLGLIKHSDDMVNHVVDNLSLVTNYFRLTPKDPSLWEYSDSSFYGKLCKDTEARLIELQNRRSLQLSQLCEAYEDELHALEKEKNTSIHNLKMEVKRLTKSANYYTAKSRQYKHQLQKHQQQKHQQQKHQQQKQQKQEQEQLKQLNQKQEEQQNQLEEQQNQLEEQQNQLEEQQNQLEEQQNQLEEQQNQLEEQQNQLEEQENQLEEQQNQLEEQQNQLEQQEEEVKSLKETLRAQYIEHDAEMDLKDRSHNNLIHRLIDRLEEEKKQTMSLQVANDIMALEIEINSVASSFSPPTIKPVPPLRYKTPPPPQPPILYGSPLRISPSPPKFSTPQPPASPPQPPTPYCIIPPPTPSRPPPPATLAANQTKVRGHKRDIMVAGTKKLSQYFKKAVPIISNIKTEQGNGKVCLAASKDGESRHSDPWYMSPVIKERRDAPRWWGKLRKKG